MREQINLYSPELLERTVPLSGELILKILAVVLVVSLLLGWREHWRIQKTRHLLTEAQNEQKQIQKSLEEKQKLQRATEVDAQLLQQVAEREYELNTKEDLLKQLETGKKEGFSRFFVGLSHVHVEGLWLRDIEVGNDAQLSVMGSVLNPDILPRYLERIAASSVFDNQHFYVLKVKPEASEKSESSNLDIATRYFELRAIGSLQ